MNDPSKNKKTHRDPIRIPNKVTVNLRVRTSQISTEIQTFSKIIRKSKLGSKI